MLLTWGWGLGLGARMGIETLACSASRYAVTVRHYCLVCKNAMYECSVWGLCRQRPCLQGLVFVHNATVMWL
jgi:hypothetical protein